jgi:hypothetical protein
MRDGPIIGRARGAAPLVLGPIRSPPGAGHSGPAIKKGGGFGVIRYLACACAVLAAAGALAGPYDKPYALVEAADRSPSREEFPPAITRIDGESTRNPRKSVPVEPGQRRVTVRFETARVAQGPDETTRELDMQLEACTRYRIAARRVGATHWEPKVYSEAIPECKRKFDVK